MYISSINPFATSLLLICLINSLRGEAEGSREMNDFENYRLQSTESGRIFIEEQLRSNIPKSPQRDIYHRNYRRNSFQPKVSSNDVYPEVYAKQNVMKSITEYQVGEEYKPYYYPGSRDAGDRRNLEKSSVEHSSQSKEHYEQARRRNEEIMKKMNALDRLLSEDTEENDIESANTVEDSIIAETSIPEETKRVVRQIRRQRPGFFWTLARLAFETFNDTRSAIKQISNIIGENFEPDTVRPSVSRKPLIATTIASSIDQSNMSSNTAAVNVTTTMPMTTTTRTTTTTEAPYKFSRNGIQDLIRRNLRGLVRLFNIEWEDALNQSDINVREFQKNLGYQVGSFLQDDPKAF